MKRFVTFLCGALLAMGACRRDRTEGKTMPSQPGITHVRKLIANFFNAHDPSVARDYFAEDVLWHGMSMGDYRGVEGYAQAMAGFWRALPDARAIEQDAIESGDRVVMRFLVEATHRGELWGIPGTGSRVRWDATMIYRMDGGKIAEQWSVEDWAAILRDLGVAALPYASGRETASGTGSTTKVSSDGPLARGLIRIGEEAIERENDAAYDAYFAESYVLHGPLGDMTRDELKRYFASLRAAFSNFRITRERILTDGKWLAARNTMSGTFDHFFEMSPIGAVQPNGRHVRFEVINLFHYDDKGRLLEEWVQVDNLGLLRQLGVRVP
ncbi:MAG TPA: ester cyclase family protein [Gemmatimonadaceae bacterium]|nr:ester cyclase family protein [Gemmatimonadaceae bacterium]